MEDGFYESLYNMEMDYYDEIEKLRVLSNEGKITGDEFLDKFFLLRSSLNEIQFVYSGIIKNNKNKGYGKHELLQV